MAAAEEGGGTTQGFTALRPAVTRVTTIIPRRTCPPTAMLHSGAHLMQRLPTTMAASLLTSERYRCLRTSSMAGKGAGGAGDGHAGILEQI